MSSSTSDKQSALRRPALRWAALACGAVAIGTVTVGAVTVGAGASSQADSAPSAPASVSPAPAHKASTSVRATVASPSSEGFVPSEFAGVSVRSRPAASARRVESGGEWIRVEPGAEPPPSTVARYGTWSTSPGRTALGGVSLRSSNGFVYESVARRSSVPSQNKSAVVIDCEPLAQGKAKGHESHAGHAHHESEVSSR